MPTENDIRPVLNAVCVKDHDIKRVTQLLYAAEIDCFGEAGVGENRKLKGKKMVHRRTIERSYTLRKEYTEKIIDIILAFDIYIFAIVMERPDFNPYQAKGMLPVHYRYLLERLNSFGLYKHTQVLLVYDKIHDKEDGLIGDGMKNFLFRHGIGKQFNNIVHMPLFVSSINNPLIRFPDLTGNVLRQYYGLGLDQRTPSDSFEQWVTQLTCNIESKTIPRMENLRGSYDYGIYFMRKELFPRNQNELSRDDLPENEC